MCRLCANSGRDRTCVCVVEMPGDVQAIERSGTYKGLYFVLMGHLSPLDGIGPREIGLDQLMAHLNTGIISEVILATNSTVEGEATAYYIAEMVRKRGIKPTRIAHGMPMGGELEYVDGGTLLHAFAGRKEL